MTQLELLNQLVADGVLMQEQQDKIVRFYENQPQEKGAPVYVRILLGLGAWFAACLFLPFLGLFGVFDNTGATFVCGAILMAASISLSRMTKSTFPAQLSLVFAFAGNILVIYGVIDAGHYSGDVLGSVAATHAVICAVMYMPLRSNVYRFLSPVIAVVLATIWIVEEGGAGSIHALVALEASLFYFLLLLPKRSHLLSPLMYSSACMLPATILFMNITQVDVWTHHFKEPLWPSSMILALGLVYFFARIAGGWDRLRQCWPVLAILATIALGFFTTPGVLIAIGVLVAGYAFQDHILSSLSYLFMPCFLVIFYYALNVDLARKSWVIAGSGAILLFLCWGIRFFPPKETVK